jgi:hypothetical protein
VKSSSVSAANIFACAASNAAISVSFIDAPTPAFSREGRFYIVVKVPTVMKLRVHTWIVGVGASTVTVGLPLWAVERAIGSTRYQYYLLYESR